jgi:NTP pyrophosphatase (non-canonical NTP hydrolase)
LTCPCFAAYSLTILAASAVQSHLLFSGSAGFGYHAAMNTASDSLTLAEFQRYISQRFEKVDRERGSAKTFLWFIEEVGELATALNGDDRANLEEEFADVIAWLCTLANINDVDLAAAISAKYLGEKRPEGHK